MKKIITSCMLLLLCSIASNASAAGYTETKYPIVLVHGLSGFDSVGGLIGYFHTIPYNLRRSGAKVYVPSVSAFNSSEERGQQLANYLNSLPEGKFNLVGHSQGAPTSRVAAALVPHRVASVTSVNGVNRGSKVADVLLGIVPEGVSRSVVGSILDAFGGVINLVSGANNEQDSIASAMTLSTNGSLALNQVLDQKGIDPNCQSTNENVNINGHNIKMFSWSGDGAYTNIFDLSDPFLATTGLAFGWEKNDGLVSVCSARLGSVISTSYSLNHLDAVNHLFGIRGWTNPVSLYRAHANRLRNKGI